MAIKLNPLALNELLGFVPLSHPAFHRPSSLILPFNLTSAVWRFDSAKHQPENPREAQSIQVTGAFKNFFGSQVSRRLIRCFEPNHSAET
jgi:hypothetical protein